MANVTIDAGKPPSWFHGDDEQWAEYLGWWFDRATHTGFELVKGVPGAEVSSFTIQKLDVLSVLDEEQLQEGFPDWIKVEGCPNGDIDHKVLKKQVRRHTFDDVCDLCGWNGPEALRAMRDDDRAERGRG